MAEENIEETFTCTLTAVAKERTTKDESTPGINKNIVNSNIECLQNKEAGSCAPGTEIRYMVNEMQEKVFYVLHDDGDTLTLQQRENTISSIAWYKDANYNTKGPITALSALEEATNGWSNVNTINYTMGTTQFNGNLYTGCDENLICNNNIYTLSSRNAKARMVTVQELVALGCTTTEKTCPVWIYDYMNGSVDYDGTTNGTGAGYLTMSVATFNNYDVWSLRFYGSLLRVNSDDTGAGIRAVIEIDK